MKKTPTGMILLAIAVLGGAAPASAQGRDPAERGLRLEHDELRNNESQKQLTRPADSGLLPQASQPQPSASPARKSRKKKRQD